MASVHAGMYPGSNANYSSYKAVSGQFTNKSSHIPKSSFSEGEMEWDLSSGWHYTRPRGWQGRASRAKKADFAYVMGTDGQAYKIYKYDLNDDQYVGFHGHTDQSNTDYQQRLAYAEHAFDADIPGHKIYEQEGVGHIAYLAYAEKFQVLKVKFQNGDTCLFFRVPSAVAGSLLAYAKSGIARADGKHLLGLAFWDYVRIRGRKYGARYPFEYESRSDGVVARHNNRHIVRLTKDTASTVIGAALGTDKKRLAALERIGGLEAGREVSVVLNDEEYAAYMSEFAKDNAKASNQWYLQGKQGSTYTDKDGKQVITGDNLGGVSVSTGEYVNPGSSAWSERQVYADKLKSKAEQELDKVRGSQIYNLKYNDLETQHPYWSSQHIDTEAIKYAAEGARILDAINKRTGEVKDDLYTLSRSINSPYSIKSWVRKNQSAAYASGLTGEVWTIQDLKDFANPQIKNNISLAHAPVYKRFIQNKDWEGALDFLKSNGAVLEYKDNMSGKIINYGKVNYASPYASLDITGGQ